MTGIHPEARGRRALFNLWLAFAIGVGLLLVNLAVNYTDPLHEFFRQHDRYRWTNILIDTLLLWLMAMLWLAFIRWRAAERRTRELEDVVSSISPDALLVVSPQRVIRLCNVSAARMFGHPMAALVGMKTDGLYSDRRTDKTHRHEIYEALERDGFHIGQATGIRRDGRTFPLEIISGELHDREGAVLVLRDTSDRLTADEQRRKLEARMHMKQKTESLGLMAAGVAHDFNNLLMVIMGRLSLLGADPALSGDARAELTEIEEAAGRAAELCRQMLAYAGKGEVRLQPVRLSAIVQEIRRVVGASLPASVQCTLNVAPDMPLVMADPTQMRQVVMNLIANAAEAIGGRQGRVTVSTGIRECSERELREWDADSPLSAGRYCYVEVADTGCGMDADTLALIFDPFYTTKAPGRGLGLACVQGIVREHRGCIRVTSRPGEGSTFTVLLPGHAP